MKLMGQTFREIELGKAMLGAVTDVLKNHDELENTEASMFAQS